MGWEDELKQSFRSEDQIFAGHPSEVRHARDMRIEAIREGPSLTNIEDAVRKYLKGCTRAHVEEQLRRVRDLGRYLDD